MSENNNESSNSKTESNNQLNSSISQNKSTFKAPVPGPSGSGGPSKSSTDILNELFGTFNSSFDESEVLLDEESKSSSSKKKHKKHEKVKEKNVEKVKEHKSKLKSEEKEKKKVKREKSERHLDKKFEFGALIVNPLDKSEKKSSKREKKEEEASTSTNKPKYPTLEINGKTIVLDVEEGEIVEEVMPPLSPKQENGDKKRKSSSSSSRKKLSSSSSSKEKKLRKKEDEDHYYYYSSDEDQSKKRHKENYYKRKWEKGQDLERHSNSYSNTYSSNSYSSSYSSSSKRRRESDPDYESSKKYNGSRGGFGYSGSSSRYEEEYYDYRRRRSRSPSHHRERSTLRRLHPDDIIDKGELLRIARKNAGKLLKQGVIATDIFTREQIIAIRAGGKNVDELTEYCKKIAKKDSLGTSGFDSSDEEVVNHPFEVKDRPMPSIIMNIRNAIPLPIRTPHELAIENAKLRTQFPVSSGTQHRYELEWKSVDNSTTTTTSEKKEKKTDNSKAVLLFNDPTLDKKPEEMSLEQGLFDDKSGGVDIGTVISKRLRAMRQLQENPDDMDAKLKLEAATSEMKEWAEKKALEPKFLTPSEIMGGPQAWAKKDQLKSAAALQGGMGMHLLQRMGWAPGEGLGKNKEGTTEPLALDIKMDKKGLASSSDLKGPSLPSVFDLSGKHPVSSLMELCAKRRWGSPAFELCFDYGPSHKRQFVYKVIVNGVEYQPCIATVNKKEAKANAAAFCLQSLGLLPTPKNESKGGAMSMKSSHLLQTVPSNSSSTSSSSSKNYNTSSSSSSTKNYDTSSSNISKNISSSSVSSSTPPAQLGSCTTDESKAGGEGSGQSSSGEVEIVSSTTPENSKSTENETHKSSIFGGNASTEGENVGLEKGLNLNFGLRPPLSGANATPLLRPSPHLQRPKNSFSSFSRPLVNNGPNSHLNNPLLMGGSNSTKPPSLLGLSFDRDVGQIPLAQVPIEQVPQPKSALGYSGLITF